MDKIESAIYQYCIERGLTPHSAERSVSAISRAVERMVRHAVTNAGFEPQKWKD